MIEEKSNENAERSRAGTAFEAAGESNRIHDGSDPNREGTLGEFAEKLRQAARDLLADNPHHDQLRMAGLMQTAATLIENSRPAAAWLRRQPRHQHSECSDYSAAQVVDLLERFAREAQKG